MSDSALIQELVETRQKLAKVEADLHAAKIDVAHLEAKYEHDRPSCNAGHKNNLPMALWDCPQCTDKLRAELAAALAECQEQARLNGMGSEREAKLMGEVAALKAELNILRPALGQTRKALLARAQKAESDLAAAVKKNESLFNDLAAAKAELSKMQELAYPDGPDGDSGWSVEEYKKLKSDLAATQARYEGAESQVRKFNEFLIRILKALNLADGCSVIDAIDRLRAELQQALAECAKLAEARRPLVEALTTIEGWYAKCEGDSMGMPLKELTESMRRVAREALRGAGR